MLLARVPSAKTRKGVVDCDVPGMKKNGKCHTAHTIPRMRLAPRALYRFWSLGKANPRHPGSSPAGPPSRPPSRNNGMIKSQGLMPAGRGSGGRWSTGGLAKSNVGPPRKKVPVMASSVTRAGSKRTTRYHQGCTRQVNHRRKKARIPPLPVVIAVANKAAGSGPIPPMNVRGKMRPDGRERSP